MKPLQWLDTDFFRVIGWSLLHSVWQLFLVLTLLRLTLTFVDRQRPNLRYLISLGFLGISLLVTCFTLVHEYNLAVMSHQGSNLASFQGVHEGEGSTVPVSEKFPRAPQGAVSGVLYLVSQICPYLALAWMIGLVAHSARLAGGFRNLCRMSKTLSEVHPLVVKKLEELCQLCAVKRPVRLIISSRFTEPAVYAYLRPVILIPAGYISQIPAEQLEMILAHELAHIKRYDYLVNLFQSALDVLFFFNPFFAGISEKIRTERECSCDELATHYLGNRDGMAVALTNLKLISTRSTISLSAAPVESDFAQRIHRLLPGEDRMKESPKNPILGLGIMAGIIILFTTCVKDQNVSGKLVVARLDGTITQVYTDNQAGSKIQIFRYTSENQDHDLFLVSTEAGSPLYGYLDGKGLNDGQLEPFLLLISKSKTIANKISGLPMTGSEKRVNRQVALSQEMEGLNNDITTEREQLRKKVSETVDQKLDSLIEEFSRRADESKNLAMEEYEGEVKRIPQEVALHELLTRIIVNRAYTPEDRERVNSLIIRHADGNQ